ncbi:hypothetical protein [Alicyclobacillus fastidiosus]|uniref:Uncharacterized protein n=1 Tax=Alicyclobacillus fastidiosus TaxID=392011 RepID=A0ABV5AHZ4_9BACL|nr:hypothetical protein [Alicyclobacillus fastidiosus]WEH10090.1 hypothetical protein PYS47_02065 [Alicyclobacillus fastidiosus]
MHQGAELSILGISLAIGNSHAILPRAKKEIGTEIGGKELRADGSEGSFMHQDIDCSRWLCFNCSVGWWWMESIRGSRINIPLWSKKVGIPSKEARGVEK